MGQFESCSNRPKYDSIILDIPHTSTFVETDEVFVDDESKCWVCPVKFQSKKVSLLKLINSPF